jgi:hypothetical protein
MVRFISVRRILDRKSDEYQQMVIKIKFAGLQCHTLNFTSVTKVHYSSNFEFLISVCLSIPFAEWLSVRVIIRVEGNRSECTRMLRTAVGVETNSLSHSRHVRFLLLALILLLQNSTCYPTSL